MADFEGVRSHAEFLPANGVGTKAGLTIARLSKAGLPVAGLTKPRLTIWLPNAWLTPKAWLAVARLPRLVAWLPRLISWLARLISRLSRLIHIAGVGNASGWRGEGGALDIRSDAH